MSFEIINPEALGAPRGFNHGLLAAPGGRVLFVAGQIGVAEAGAGGDFVEQFAAALAKVIAVVEHAGGGAADIGRLTIYVTEMSAYRDSLDALGVAYRGLMGKHYPAMALLGVRSLVDPHAVVEIEATAVLAS